MKRQLKRVPNGHGFVYAVLLCSAGWLVIFSLVLFGLGHPLMAVILSGVGAVLAAALLVEEISEDE
jgi:hypothetical protein